MQWLYHLLNKSNLIFVAQTEIALRLIETIKVVKLCGIKTSTERHSKGAELQTNKKKNEGTKSFMFEVFPHIDDFFHYRHFNANTFKSIQSNKMFFFKIIHYINKWPCIHSVNGEATWEWFLHFRVAFVTWKHFVFSFPWRGWRWLFSDFICCCSLMVDSV